MRMHVPGGLRCLTAACVHTPAHACSLPPTRAHARTRQYELGCPAEALEPLGVAEAIPPPLRPALPPYNGFGTLEDSKQNCVALVPKPPKKVCVCPNGGSVHGFAGHA